MRWTPLLYLGEGQARFWVYDSLLSEYAAMGFEYGYSVERPDALVLWEAQFGDFAERWPDHRRRVHQQLRAEVGPAQLGRPAPAARLRGPGPDHSSARIERYLQLCAENNMTVAFPSTAASYFHLLRRQAYARPRPLVVFTPKSMLRSKAAASPVEAFTQGGFQPVLADHEGRHAERRPCPLRLRQGRARARRRAVKREDTSTAIIRVEQLYPIRVEEIRQAASRYPGAELVWIQDEPRNQGAWPLMAQWLHEDLSELGEARPWRVIARKASASPATGSTRSTPSSRQSSWTAPSVADTGRLELTERSRKEASGGAEPSGMRSLVASCTGRASMAWRTPRDTLQPCTSPTAASRSSPAGVARRR